MPFSTRHRTALWITAGPSSGPAQAWDLASTTTTGRITTSISEALTNAVRLSKLIGLAFVVRVVITDYATGETVYEALVKSDAIDVRTNQYGDALEDRQRAMRAGR